MLGRNLSAARGVLPAVRHRAPLPAVALACALVLAGCGGQGGTTARDGRTTSASDPDSARTAPPSRTEIPDGFPLSAGMAAPEDEVATSRTGTGLRDLELCGAMPLRGLGVRDRMVADNSGGEALDTRELVLLGSPEEAAQLARRFTDLSIDCDAPTDQQGFETRTQLRGSAFGPSPAATLVQTYEVRGESVPGTMVIHVVPAGAALLVTSTYGEWPADDLDEGVVETADAVRRTVAALDDFGGASSTPTPSSTPTQSPTAVPTDDASPTASPTEASPTVSPTDEASPTASPTAEPSPEPSGPVEIPADFPLAVGLPDDGGDYEAEEPSADGTGVGEVEMCGRVVWPIDGTAGGTRRLATGVLGPEYFDGRELIVHPDAEVASSAMAAIRRAARVCRASDNQVWTVLDHDTGYDTVTMGLSYSDGLGSSVFQATRVGSARLMVSTYGEGSIDSLDAQADAVTATTRQIVAAMCVFTRTGC